MSLYRQRPEFGKAKNAINIRDQVKALNILGVLAGVRMPLQQAKFYTVQFANENHVSTQFHNVVEHDIAPTDWCRE